MDSLIHGLTDTDSLTHFTDTDSLTHGLTDTLTDSLTLMNFLTFMNAWTH